MKQQILNLKKKLLLVELPEGADRLKVFNDESEPYISYFKGHSALRFYLSSKCLLIGKLTDIAEQQFLDFCDFFTHEDEMDGTKENVFRDYTDKTFFDTAKESFFSYLESQGIYFSNPLGEKPFVSVFDINPDSVVRKEYYKWEEAEQKVWNKDLIYIFEVI
jgi:hypothetical protein